MLLTVESDYYVDTANGKDNHSGTSPAKAFQSLAGVAAALGFMNTIVNDGGLVAIHLLGDVPPADPFRPYTILGPGVMMVIAGGVKAVLHQGTLTGVTALNQDANQPFEIVDMAAPAGCFTTNLSRRVTMTSGAAAGSQAWILRDLGGGRARVSTWCQPQPVTGTAMPAAAPSPGDSYQIEDLYQVTLADYDVRSVDSQFAPNTFPFLSAVIFTDVQIQPNLQTLPFGLASVPQSMGSLDGRTGWVANNCRIAAQLTDQRSVSLVNPLGAILTNCCLLDVLTAHTGVYILAGASVRNAAIPESAFTDNFDGIVASDLSAIGAVAIGGDFIFQGDPNPMNGMACRLSVNGKAVLESVAFFDSIETIDTFSSGQVLMTPAVIGQQQRLWGSGNFNPVIGIGPGWTFTWLNPPIIISPPGGPVTKIVPTIANNNPLNADWAGDLALQVFNNAPFPPLVSFYFDDATATWQPPGGIPSQWANFKVARPHGFAYPDQIQTFPDGGQLVNSVATAIDPNTGDNFAWNQTAFIPPPT